MVAAKCSRLLTIMIIMPALLAGGLTGCASEGSVFDYFKTVDKGSPEQFRNETYFAADELARGLVKELPAQVPIYPGYFTSIDTSGYEVAADAPFPDMLMRYSSSRLVQRGFRFGGTEGDSTNSNQFYKGKFGRVVLGGDYLISKDNVLIHLEVLDEGSGRILSAQDYSVPLNEEVKTYLRSPAATAAARQAEQSKKSKTINLNPFSATPDTSYTPPPVAIAPAPAEVRATPLPPAK